MIDVIDDLWSIFECGVCGVLFFSEERVQIHIDQTHPNENNLNYNNMEFIRAVSQNPHESINGEINP